MANRIVLNETSYHGAGAIREIPGQVKGRGFQKAFVCSDPDLIQFGVTKKVTDVLEEAGLAYEIYSDIKPNPTIGNVQTGVEAEVAALKEGRFEDFLSGITASGNSSWKWLQNCYTNASCQEQGITVALALTELFIAEKKRGACRVHGGGFAGVIMAMLPNDLVDEYVTYMEAALGEGSAYRMSIRPYGAVCINDLI